MYNNDIPNTTHKQCVNHKVYKPYKTSTREAKYNQGTRNGG